MLLERPAFSPRLSAVDAQKAVASLLKKNRWKKYSFSEKQLFFIPYWFFSYDIHSHEGKKTNLISSGFSSLNAFSNEIDDSVAALAQDAALAKSNEPTVEGKTNVVNPRVSQEEAREIISVRLASDEETSKENVIISGFEMFFVPIWLFDVNLGGHKIPLRINAVDSNIENAKAVPFRGKDFSELMREMLSELSTLQGWIEYSSGAARLISKTIMGAAGGGKSKKTTVHVEAHVSSEKREAEEVLSQDDVQVILLAVVAIIVILWAVYRF